MINYNGGTAISPSSVDKASGKPQLNPFYWIKKAITTARKEEYFGQIAGTWTMPKHFGKKAKVLEYYPLLDDRNVNDQGIDAAGVTIANGNLYGSSRDIGKVLGKMPTVGETGGRVNRVGFTRIEREGSIVQFGVFTEFTRDSMELDTDPMLMEHITRELMNGMYQLSEAILQADILNGAGTILYAGSAVSNGTVTGEGADKSEVDYSDLMKLEQILTDNRTPKQTTVYTGSRNIDTVTIPAGRILYVGSELALTLRTMKDAFGDPAFIPVQKYAGQGNVLNGEIGTIYEFRIVQVPEMLHWAGVGAEATAANAGYRSSIGADGKERYDVFPMLVVGEDSFIQIGFQTDGRSLGFSIITKMPGKDTAHAETDPYGLRGFSSIRWWYGILVRRPERIGLIKTVARG